MITGVNGRVVGVVDICAGLTTAVRVLVHCSILSVRARWHTREDNSRASRVRRVSSSRLPVEVAHTIVVFRREHSHGPFFHTIRTLPAYTQIQIGCYSSSIQ